MRCSRSVAIRLASLFCLCPLFAAAGRAESQIASLSLRMDASGYANVHLWMSEEPSDEEATLRALSTALGCPLQDVSFATDDSWGLTARAHVMRRRGLVSEGRLNLAALAGSPKATGIGSVCAIISMPETGFSRCSLSSQPREGSFAGQVFPADRPVTVAYGYSTRQVCSLLWPFFLALIAPFAATLWMRRATLGAKPADPTTLWFGYWRFLQTLGTATWIVWYAIFLTLPVARCLRYLVPASEGGAFILEFTLLVIPPLVVALLCQAMSNDVFTQVRGSAWTAKDMRRQIFWNLIASAVPLLLLLIGVGGVIDGNERLAALGLILALFVSITGRRALVRARDMTLHALTVGPLRDRVFALAQQAQVELQQLYVLPSGKGRMVNAFATTGLAVVLSEELVARSSRREVDAIVAHELSHMRKGHVGLAKRILRVLFLAAAGGAAGAISAAVPNLDRFRFLVPLGFVLIIAMVTFFSRRRERAADAGSATITGDPEAMISALARLSRMNQLPVQWSRWQERFISHPSTVRRAEALAARFGIPLSRLDALLNPPDAGDSYPVPARSEMDQRIFSTSFKQGLLGRMMWTLLTVSVLVPSAAGLIVQQLGLKDNAMWAVYGAGFVVAPLAWLMAYDRLSTLGYLGLRDKLAARLSAEGILPEDAAGAFVSFAPNGSYRVYEGFHDWDIGFAILTGTRFCFVGEQTRFALTREQVPSITLHPGPAGWLRFPRVQVCWRDGEREGAFLLNSSLGRRRRMARETRALLDSVTAWHEGHTEGKTDSLPILGSPEFGEVTSSDPAAGGQAGGIVVMAVFGAGGACLFGLSFDPPAYTGWYVVAVTAFVGLLSTWPARRRWRRRKAKAPKPD